MSNTTHAGYSAGTFSIDSTPEKSLLYSGFSDPAKHWNGWAIPVFTRDVIEQVLRDANGSQDSIAVTYCAESDSFSYTYKDHPDDTEVDQGVDILVDGQTLRVYKGPSGWCWDRLPQVAKVDG